MKSKDVRAIYIKGEERLGAFIQGFYWLLIIEVNCSQNIDVCFILLICIVDLIDDLFQVQSNMGSMQQRTWKDIFDNESEHLIHIETGSTFIPTIMQ